ncbi:hypothetical protein [Pasteurella sp. PK-2025]|uniref:hypothetical protein n=1 Tax=Pasteurella sp. PK-2025 TaxID=3413133 RepID=UPI003C762A4A
MKQKIKSNTDNPMLSLLFYVAILAGMASFFVAPYLFCYYYLKMSATLTGIVGSVLLYLMFVILYALFGSSSCNHCSGAGYECMNQDQHH